MPLLSQVIGHATDSKKALKALLTEVYQRLQKPSTYTGLSRTYRPLLEGGVEYPPENNPVQTTVVKELLQVGVPLTEFINDSLTLAVGNTKALVDVVVEGEVLFAKVPPTFLMELKKQLTDMSTLLGKLPVQDSNSQWTVSPNAGAGVYVSEPTQTIKTQKKKQFLSVAKATDKHPEQVQVWDEDVPIGTYFKVDYTGAIPLPVRNQLVARISTLEKAVNDALAEANAQSVKVQDGGDVLVRYLFQDVLTP